LYASDYTTLRSPRLMQCHNASVTGQLCSGRNLVFTGLIPLFLHHATRTLWWRKGHPLRHTGSW